jgi:uncharacterized protein
VGLRPTRRQRDKLSSMLVEAFAPFQDLAAQLLPWLDESTDGSHDLSHLKRVWQNAQILAEEEGANLHLLAAAVLLHDCVHVEKGSPLRDQASRLSAERAGEALSKLGWESHDIEVVTDAVLCHSYSAGLVPTTPEARVLQDADRLDAIGLVGVARCFYTAGRLGSSLYHPDDPAGQNRTLDDRSYALDHFPKKLLTLATGFRTAAGRRMARKRHAHLQEFYDAFVLELEA